MSHFVHDSCSCTASLRRAVNGRIRVGGIGSAIGNAANRVDVTSRIEVRVLAIGLLLARSADRHGWRTRLVFTPARACDRANP